jgi:hypothetical protein
VCAPLALPVVGLQHLRARVVPLAVASCTKPCLVPVSPPRCCVARLASIVASRLAPCVGLVCMALLLAIVTHLEDGGCQGLCCHDAHIACLSVHRGGQTRGCGVLVLSVVQKVKRNMEMLFVRGDTVILVSPPLRTGS